MFDLIELFYFAYRDFVGDADRLLEAYGFGRAHHRVLHFVSRQPGLDDRRAARHSPHHQAESQPCSEGIDRRGLHRGAGRRSRPAQRQLYATRRARNSRKTCRERRRRRFAHAMGNWARRARPGHRIPARNDRSRRTRSDDRTDRRRRRPRRFRCTQIGGTL